MTPPTAAEYNAAISAAIRDGDMHAAVALLRLMAIRHPREAQLTYDAINLAISTERAS